MFSGKRSYSFLKIEDVESLLKVNVAKKTSCGNFSKNSQFSVFTSYVIGYGKRKLVVICDAAKGKT